MHKEIMKYFQYIILLTVFLSCSNTNKTEETQNEDLPTVNIELSSLDSASLSIFWQMAEESNLQEKSIPKIQTIIADWFMETPYVGGTLDINYKEQLVINLQDLDCVTFVENVTVLGMCVKSGELSNEKYFENLQNIRYRDGKINGYISRLHYFTDWLLDNQNKGLITIVSNDFGDVDFNASVSFMSQNPQHYKPLSDSSVLEKIRKIEKRISASKLKMVTKEYLESVESLIQDGDLIAIASTVKGVDIAHTGIAKHHNGRLHLMHASSVNEKVILSEKPLSEYLKGIKTDSGVLIARVN